VVEFKYRGTSRADAVILLSVLLASFSVWIFLSQQRGIRLRTIAGVSIRTESVSELSPKSRMVVGAAGGVLLGWTFGGVVGAAIGAFVAGWVTRRLNRRELSPHIERENELTRDTPVMIDLLCAALVSGATVRDSLVVVRDAIPGSPIADILHNVISTIDLGANPVDAWVEWVNHPVIGGLAQSIVRSSDSGAALVDVLEGVSRELRSEHRRRVELAARTAGVKSVIPLAACFLPAFFALGVVPIVASLASSTGFLGY